ncbi:MAG: PD40 domain-containing protein [Sulfuricella sp.]|nr:PD40 domain-containing protein [Sulfuricella sp.]
MRSQIWKPCSAFLSGLLVLGLSSPATALQEAFELLTRNPADGSLPDSLYNSDYPSVTPDGRYVVFESSQAKLVTPASNGVSQIFLYDRKTNRSELVSVNAAGTPGDKASNRAAISADGCKVVFESYATNLSATDINGYKDVYLRDRCSTPPQTTLLSLGTSGEPGTYTSGNPDISADGKTVVYAFGGSKTTLEGVYLSDLQSGTAQCISISEATGKCGAAGNPSISADGSRVAFYAYSPLLKSDTNGVWDIYLYDKKASPSLSIVSVSSSGQPRDQGNESTSRIVEPVISADGRYVAFATTSSVLVANDSNGLQDVFVKDTQTGKMTLASVSSSGLQGDGDSPAGQGERPSLSADGSWVVFSTSAKNLAPRSGGSSNVVAHNNLTGESVDFFTTPRFGVGSRPAISGDAQGRFVAFFASDKLDTRFDSAGVFLHDRTTQCLLNWAESSYAAQLAPAGGATQIAFPYTYRYYAQTQAYLGTSNADDHVYYLGPATGNVGRDLGAAAGFLQAAGCR